MASVLSRPCEPQLERPLQSFHVLTLGTSHNYPEFVWNVAPVWGKVTHSLHYILKGFYDPKRPQTSHLVPSPHCRGQDPGGTQGGVEGPGRLMGLQARMEFGFCIHEIEASQYGCFSASLTSASGDLGWACGRAGCEVSDRGEVQGVINLFLLHREYMTSK